MVLVERTVLKPSDRPLNSIRLLHTFHWSGTTRRLSYLILSDLILSYIVYIFYIKEHKF